MDQMHDFFNKGLGENYNGYKLGKSNGFCWGIIWGVVVSIAFPFGNWARSFHGQIEHSMMIVSNIILLLACLIESPTEPSRNNEIQKAYGFSRMYEKGYSLAYLKYQLVGISLVLAISSILSIYNVFRDKIGIWVAICCYLSAISISLYVYFKSPSKKYDS